MTFTPSSTMRSVFGFTRPFAKSASIVGRRVVMTSPRLGRTELSVKAVWSGGGGWSVSRRSLRGGGGPLDVALRQRDAADRTGGNGDRARGF